MISRPLQIPKPLRVTPQAHPDHVVFLNGQTFDEAYKAAAQYYNDGDKMLYLWQERQESSRPLASKLYEISQKRTTSLIRKIGDVHFDTTMETGERNSDFAFQGHKVHVSRCIAGIGTLYYRTPNNDEQALRDKISNDRLKGTEECLGHPIILSPGQLAFHFTSKSGNLATPHTIPFINEAFGISDSDREDRQTELYTLNPIS